MEVLKNVLIKEIDGGKLGDRVMFVDNLPKHLIYKKVAARMYDINGDRLVPEYVFDERGNKRLTNRMVDELLPGIEMSESGDGAFNFYTMQLEAQYRLRDIDNYLRGAVPVAERLPERVPYAAQPGIMTSGTIPLSAIPRVVLPEPVSPPAQAVQVSAPTAAIEVPAKKARKPMTEEQKQAARERLARARELKKQQQAPQA